MRSTEASGVRAGGTTARREHVWGLASVRRAAASISPVTFAVLLTGLAAASLYLVSEAISGISDLGSRSAIAYGLAVLAGLLSLRRRPTTAVPAQTGYAPLLESIREEQRVLARRYHEEKLRAEAASRSKTAFLAHLSHDIRTPLNHIIGFAEMMRHQTYGPLGDERYMTYVESIRMSGERLLGFFGSILDLAELEGGRRELEVAPLAVDDLMLAASRRFSAQAQRARVTLSLGVPCGASILGDRFSLDRVLGNLLDNALRFTPAGGRVTLAAHAAMDGVVLEITDTGLGMSAERVSALSQPFAFGDATLAKDREGAGLGLAIARAIVELSGGHLAIDSRPSIGTTVAVSLPAHDMQQPIGVAA